ncbi:MAG: serpin family protein [Erysipelotrichaceae bacterium]|nr:serpin family protein [Erysipelotrichaceae bacterium]
MKNIITTLNNTETNNVFSPVSLYYALGLLSQVTDGETKKEILNVLNLKEDKALDKMNDIYKAFNINREDGRLMLNSSLWFSDRFNIYKDKADEIAKDTNSAIRYGQMGTTEFDNQIRRWINVNTHNLLKDSVENIKTTSDGILSLISTIYLKGNWDNKFEECDTKNDIFHVSDKEEVKCKFMNQYIKEDLLIGKRFKALCMYINGIGAMAFIKPNEGLSLSDISNDNDLIELLNGNVRKLDRKYYLINFSVPKFDITLDNSIIEQIKMLGVNKALDMNEADFSVITDEKQVYVNDAKQATRLKIDEEGVEGAAYTYLSMVCGGICLDEPEEIDFKLDKPFMFSVFNDSAPMFVGTIVDPTKE